MKLVSEHTLMILKVAEPPVEKRALRIIANTATLTESSMAAEANNNVGIPFATP